MFRVNQPWPCCPEQRPPGTRRSSSLPPRFRPRPVPLRRVPTPLHPEAGPAAPNATAAPRRCSRTSAEQHPHCPACAAARRTRRGGEKPTTRKRLPPAWGCLTLLLLPLVPAPTRKREPGAVERVWRAARARATRELSSGGRSALVCAAGVKAWMMGPGERERVRGVGDDENEIKHREGTGAWCGFLHFAWEIIFSPKLFFLLAA